MFDRTIATERGRALAVTEPLPTHLRQLEAMKEDSRVKAQTLNNVCMNENRDFTPAEQNEYDAHVAMMGRCDEAIRHQRKHGGWNGGPMDDQVFPNYSGFAGLRLPEHNTGQGDRNLGGSIREALRNATAEEREEVTEFVGYLQGRMSASADLSPSNRGGGFPIPEFVQAAIERNFAAFTPVLNNCRVLATDTGADITIPVLSDSETAVQIAPAAATGADDTVSGDTPPTELTGPKLSSYKLSSKPVYVPRETLVDGSGDIIGDVLAALLARIARYENYLYTRGTGSGQPQGFVTGATALLEANQLDLDVALDLAYACPALYRPQGIYMASDATVKYLRKLKTGISGDKRVIWNDANFQTGQPATLHGYPIFVNNDLPDIAASGYVAGHELCFGDFSRFLVRRAENGSAFVYNYGVPAKDGRGLICFRRSDSRLLVPEAIVKLSVGGS